MSKNNPPVDVEKVISIFEKSSIDEQIVAFHELKNWLTVKIVEHAQVLEEQQNKFLKIKDTISK